MLGCRGCVAGLGRVAIKVALGGDVVRMEGVLLLDGVDIVG